MTEQDMDKFLKEYTALCIKHKITIASCDCCGLWLEKAHFDGTF